VPSVAFYISGHGFGHASRQIEIINALGAAAAGRTRHRDPHRRGAGCSTTVRAFHTAAGECDTGAQVDSLRLDEAATIRTAAAFHRDLTQLASEEAGCCREHGPAGHRDAPPLGCAAAAAAAIPSIVIANFTWDWIYDGYEALAAEPTSCR
jgi:hypothetical protein